MSTTSAPAKAGPRQFLCTRDDKSQIMLSVRHPTKRELDASDIEYSGEFNRNLLAGLPTSQKMARQLRANEVWSPKDDSDITQLIQDLRAAENAVRATADKSPERDVAQKALEVIQAALNGRQSEFKAMLAHTADNKAEDAQRNFLIACTVEKVDDGKRLWEKIDDLLDCEDIALINRCTYEYMMMQADLPSEWESLMAAQKKEAEKLEQPKKEPEVQPEPKVATQPEVQSEAPAVLPVEQLAV